MTAISLLTDCAGIKSPVLLTPGSRVTLRKPLHLSGRSVPICRRETWLNQISKVPFHSYILIQE